MSEIYMCSIIDPLSSLIYDENVIVQHVPWGVVSSHTTRGNSQILKDLLRWRWWYRSWRWPPSLNGSASEGMQHFKNRSR
jgi:hypothetical protein